MAQSCNELTPLTGYPANIDFVGTSLRTTTRESKIV
jgi:hypothetical protein